MSASRARRPPWSLVDVNAVRLFYDCMIGPASPFPSLLIDCPPTVALPDTDPGSGAGAAGCGETTFRICART